MSEDGIIEAVESETGNILAVQWHPERMLDGRMDALSLFQKMVDLAQRKISERDGSTYD